MPLQQTSSQFRRTTRPVAEAMVSSGSPSANEIPFDYVSRFPLTGIRATRIQDVINISVEGAFVAVAIGYSFVPASLPILNEAIESSPSTPAEGIQAANQSHPLLSFIEPFVRPRSDSTPIDSPDGRQTQQLQFIKMFTECSLVKLCGINFRYSIVDSGSGRELQNQPIHNIAGLGESNGDRPFRPFAKPMIFLPRSTIRIEVEEISEGPLYEGAELYIVLHGYKMLGYGTAI
ncbi:MAG: hypothetical protein F6K18_04630 [Okeania sp. SIO2C2]|uniref:hypothetical protein n=1 Tax=Okeania sp. SIO2C2 TaxID=2607787 RepID=UPI0013BA2243|nr:hypothetical protein [Okeania sp. SIO2C2]NEP86160.1 hypothetical protein [Okeania sp. SIO2C2]